MPAIYAHDRFGMKVSERLDGRLREIVTRYYPQFSIGLQGPDIFFFTGRIKIIPSSAMVITCIMLRPCPFSVMLRA